MHPRRSWRPHTVRHRVMETDGFWPASQFPTSARKPKRQPASFQSSRHPHVRYVVVVATTGCLHPSFSMQVYPHTQDVATDLSVWPQPQQHLWDLRTLKIQRHRCPRGKNRAVPSTHPTGSNHCGPSVAYLSQRVAAAKGSNHRLRSDTRFSLLDDGHPEGFPVNTDCAMITTEFFRCDMVDRHHQTVRLGWHDRRPGYGDDCQLDSSGWAKNLKLE